MGERFRNIDKTFACSFFNCKASFSKSWRLEAHFCKHTGLRPFPCLNCDRSFCTRCQLAKHQLSHSGVKPYGCSVEGCSQTFTSAGSMNKHVARAHQRLPQQKETSYMCDVEGCEKVFRKKNQLQTHKCEHTKVFPYMCSFPSCNQRFAGARPLQKHSKVHDGYPCAESGCAYKGNTWSEYQEHRRSHRVALHCDGCRKVFRQAWFLSLHTQRVHVGERRVFRCPSPGCSQNYTTYFNLQSHVKTIHENVRPFKCSKPGCDKAFAMQESLLRHGVVHDPERKKIKKGAVKKSKMAQGSAAAPDAAVITANLRNLKLTQDNPPYKPQVK